MAKHTGLSKEALEDLKRSGLDAADAKLLRVRSLDAAATAEALGFEALRFPSYQLPYFDLGGKPTGFFRVRFLAEVTRLHEKGANRKKLLKYMQPANTDVSAYFPPLGIEWSRIAADPSIPVMITEGEKKAAKTCKHGIACIGLGGIWNFKPKRFELIEDLKAFEWESRTVVIAFDSDPKPNPGVEGAVHAIGRTLERQSAIVKRLVLPINGTGAKVGLDDYLIEHSIDELKAIPQSELFGHETLEAFNNEVVFISTPMGYFHLETRGLHTSPRRLIEGAFANRQMLKVNNAGQPVEVNAFLEWTKWPRRREYSSVVYEPGKPPVTKANELNTWVGWGVEPKAGDVSLWHELLNFVFHGDPVARKWFEQWAAYPIQHPGAKLYTAVVLWSRAQGTGKSLIGETLRMIYGAANSSTIGEEHLHATFNEWQANKQFILGEEVTGSDRRAEADRLKRVITGERVRINQKHLAAYEVRDCVNYLFTTNHPNAFLLDAADRRFFVHEVGIGAEQPSEHWFQNVYDSWYRSTEGAAALHYYLRHVKLDGFGPRARAPITKARDEMVELSGNDADHIVRDFLAAPELTLRNPTNPQQPVTCDLWRSKELSELLDPMGRMLSPRRLGDAFARAGVPKREVRIGPTSTVKVYAVRNLQKWKKADGSAWAEHYNAHLAPINKDVKF